MRVRERERVCVCEPSRLTCVQAGRWGDRRWGWGQRHGDRKQCISLFKLQSDPRLNYTGVSYQKLFPILE